MLKSVKIGKNKKAVVKISLIAEDGDDHTVQDFLIRPTVVIKKSVLESIGIDKSAILRASPFCDIANELIENVGAQTVCFLSNYDYRLFVSEFKTIGYNCQLSYKTLDFALKMLEIPPEEADISTVYERFAVDGQLPLKDFSEVEMLRACHILLSKSRLNAEPVAPENQRKLASIQVTNAVLQKPGVYYLKNSEDEVIYVGKAKKVKNRLQAHFSAAGNGSHIMYSEMATIDIEYTGSDLIAQLLESHEIKELRPKYNSQQVKTPAPFQIVIKKNKRGIMRFALESKTYEDSQSEKYYNRNSAKARLKQLCSTFTLCPKFCALERTGGACSASKTGKCLGVCNKNEEVATYNARVELADLALQEEIAHKILQVGGRKMGEIGFVLISNGIYQGFGYYTGGDSIATLNDLDGYLHRYPNNYDTQRIVDTLLKKTPKERIIDIFSGF